MGDADLYLAKDQIKRVAFEMGGHHPDIAALAIGIAPGMQFDVLEGPHLAATGVVDDVETRTMDE